MTRENNFVDYAELVCVSALLFRKVISFHLKRSQL